MNQSCLGPWCPGKAKARTEPRSAYQGGLTWLSPPSPTRPYTQGSQFPGVWIEEGEWEEQRQVYLVPQGLCHPFLFLPSFLIPPQPEAGPQIAPSFFFPPSIRATQLTQVSFPNPALFPPTIRLVTWKRSISRPDTKTCPGTMVDIGVLRATLCWKEKSGLEGSPGFSL